jgi:hypothetical protein
MIAPPDSRADSALFGAPQLTSSCSAWTAAARPNPIASIPASLPASIEKVPRSIAPASPDAPPGSAGASPLLSAGARRPFVPASATCSGTVNRGERGDDGSAPMILVGPDRPVRAGSVGAAILAKAPASRAAPACGRSATVAQAHKSRARRARSPFRPLHKANPIMLFFPRREGSNGTSLLAESRRRRFLHECKGLALSHSILTTNVYLLLNFCRSVAADSAATRTK